MKNNRVLKIFLIIILVLTLLFAAFSWYIGEQVAQGAMGAQSRDDTIGVTDGFYKKYGVDKDAFLSAYTFEEISVTSSLDGHTIPAQLIYSDTADNDTVILVHGMGGNMYKNHPLAELFLSMGYNVLTYDQRGAGGNTAEGVTFGALEKFDLIDCLEYLDTVAPDRKRGVWGTSQGGATAVLAAAHEDTCSWLDFIILDCPLGNMKYMVDTEMQSMNTGIPVGYMSWCGDIILRMRYGYSYADADAERLAEKITVPTLVINSRADTLTPYFMGENIYNGIVSDKKQIWTVDDSAHTEVWLDHNAEYRQRVSDFIASL